MIDAVERAVSLFREGFLCSQSLLLAYAPDFGLEAGLAARLATGFGAGMSRMGATCGAVTGAVMVFGLARGGVGAADREAKEEVYRLVREFVARFEARHGSLACRELLGCDLGTPEGLQRAREQGLFEQRCPGFVEDAATIVAELLVLPQG